MNKIWVIAVVSVILMITTAAWAGPIPDTGQAKCYDVAGGQITCPSPGQALYGQDANFTINPMSYTKLDDTGNVLPDSTAFWAMTRDNVTGLIWENKTDNDSIHDKDHTYTWYDGNPATNGGGAGTPGDGTDTEDFLKALNDADFGGYSDWRLPTLKELSTIANYNIPSPGPAIDTGFFSNTQAALYWSSTPYATSTSAARGVNFYDGYYGGTYEKNVSTYVRAVRGGQSGSSDNSATGSLDAAGSGSTVDASAADRGYTDNGDGTVTDASTGLMWQKVVPIIAMTWEQALGYCEGLDHGGFTDWRLPNIKELQSLVNFSFHNPAIDAAFFLNTVSSFYWTSTTGVNFPYFAGGVDFRYGGDGYAIKSGSGYVRAVRGGQPESSGHLKILSPVQADTWEIGRQKIITWNTQGIAGNVSISISRDGGRNYTSIADAVPNSGTCLWTASGPASVNCMVKIEPLGDFTKGTVQGLFTLSQGCTAILDGDLSLRIPYLSYTDPSLETLVYWADFAHEFSPMYPTSVIFKLTHAGILQHADFPCEASTLSGDFKIHIPDVLFPDGITHFWVDLEYFPALSTDTNAYFIVTDSGVISD